MTEGKPSKEFWDRADRIISIANEQCDDFGIGEVSSSLLYAAARFNSFVIAANADSPEDMVKDKSEALDYFTEQYRRMLEENLDDYIRNFGSYKSEE